MADTFRVITCDMGEAQANLNVNAEEWSLHLFLPSPDHARVTIVWISSRVLRMQQIQNARGN